MWAMKRIRGIKKKYCVTNVRYEMAEIIWISEDQLKLVTNWMNGFEVCVCVYAFASVYRMKRAHFMVELDARMSLFSEQDANYR